MNKFSSVYMASNIYIFLSNVLMQTSDRNMRKELGFFAILKFSYVICHVSLHNAFIIRWSGLWYFTQHNYYCYSKEAQPSFSPSNCFLFYLTISSTYFYLQVDIISGTKKPQEEEAKKRKSRFDQGGPSTNILKPMVAPPTLTSVPSGTKATIDAFGGLKKTK